MLKHTTPWVEKYRPNQFDDIVLEKFNKILFDNILSSNQFPNLLLYGPPGTGKTTTIINIINSYQKNNNCIDKSLLIHLNASDERGIDIIRNNINSFVNSKSLFKKGMKFVILDEVDYMTKNAQQALKYLLKSQPDNVRFCLICNYISRIDESLQNEFVRIRFNQLPQEKIIGFLKKISELEELKYTESQLISIQNLFSSDMRSMINYMQSNQNDFFNLETFNNKIWENMLELLKIDINETNKFLNKLTKDHNIDPKNVIKLFMNYLIRFRIDIINSKTLDVFQNILHNKENDNNYYQNYFFAELHNILQS